jgi:bacteriorhodopsin
VTAAIWVGVVLAFVAEVFAFGVYFKNRRPSPMRDQHQPQVIVNLTSGSAFRGLATVGSETIAVTGAVLLDGKGGEQPVDGEVVVFTRSVEFVQLLP